ncbi:MAG: sensor histidine kinase [Anaerolineales bacterium]|nr:sensor histidine kinase [Anaerolineales bacterium]
MPEKKVSAPVQKVERDPRMFMWFMTLVIMVMYSATLISSQLFDRLWLLVAYTFLVVMHLVLHWTLEKAAGRPYLVTGYVIFQGLMAFIISWIGNDPGMVFALFMALIGESIGLLRFTRAGILAVAYYLGLLLFAYVWVVGWTVTWWWLLAVLVSVTWVAVYVTLYIRQLEAREQAQALLAELEIANRQLSEYAARVEDLTLANERQRMARELHDTLSQGLAGLILQLEAADAHLNKKRTERAGAIIREAMQQARETLASARRAIGDLRTKVEDYPGLEQALEAEVERFRQATGLPCDLVVDLEHKISQRIVETVWRIVSEALTNVASHARASRAGVQVEEFSGQVCLKVTDDGQSFDPLAVAAGHYGLLGMQERARLVGGSLEIACEPGKGTRVKVCLPMEVHYE